MNWKSCEASTASCLNVIPGETTTLFLSEIARELSLNRDKLQRYADRYTSYKEAGIYANT